MILVILLAACAPDPCPVDSDPLPEPQVYHLCQYLEEDYSGVNATVVVPVKDGETWEVGNCLSDPSVEYDFTDGCEDATMDYKVYQGLICLAASELCYYEIFPCDITYRRITVYPEGYPRD